MTGSIPVYATKQKVADLLGQLLVFILILLNMQVDHVLLPYGKRNTCFISIFKIDIYKIVTWNLRCLYLLACIP